MCQNDRSGSHKPEAGSVMLDSFILTASMHLKEKSREGYSLKHFVIYSFTLHGQLHLKKKVQLTEFLNKSMLASNTSQQSKWYGIK